MISVFYLAPVQIPIAQTWGYSRLIVGYSPICMAIWPLCIVYMQIRLERAVYARKQATRHIALWPLLAICVFDPVYSVYLAMQFCVKYGHTTCVVCHTVYSVFVISCASLVHSL